MALFGIPVTLFLLGLAVGSFLNVLSMRYTLERGLFPRETMTGRSRCPHCKKELSAIELIPLVSFVMQGGKCRTCKHRLSFQYPIVELLTAILFVALNAILYRHYGVFEKAILGESTLWYYGILAVWLITLVAFILITLIDLRLTIIPDSLNILIALAGIIIAAILIKEKLFDPLQSSYLGHYGLLFGFRDSIVWNRFVGALAGGVLFTTIVVVTRGRGMGIGDVKLAAALGVLLGWPDAILALLIAFVIGAIAGLFLIARKMKSFKDGIPFGPFIILGALIVLFWGEAIMRGYFSLFPI